MSDSPPAKPIVAIVASGVWGALLIPGLLGAALSVMFFDAPGSMQNPAAWANALIVVSFPILCCIAIAGSWIVWAATKRARSRGAAIAGTVIACLPLLPVLYIGIALATEVLDAMASGNMGLHSTMIHPPPTPTHSTHRTTPTPTPKLLIPIPTIQP